MLPWKCGLQKKHVDIMFSGFPYVQWYFGSNFKAHAMEKCSFFLNSQGNAMNLHAYFFLRIKPSMTYFGCTFYIEIFVSKTHLKDRFLNFHFKLLGVWMKFSFRISQILLILADMQHFFKKNSDVTIKDQMKAFFFCFGTFRRLFWVCLIPWVRSPFFKYLSFCCSGVELAQTTEKLSCERFSYQSHQSCWPAKTQCHIKFIQKPMNYVH